MLEQTAMNVLDVIYQKAMNGVPGSESVPDLAEYYLNQSGSLTSKVDSLIRRQIAKCGTTGFVTGLGGFLTLPVAVSADVGVNLYVQTRMAAAIAYMGGYDVHHEKVRSFVYLALCGNAAKEILKRSGIEIAEHYGTNLIAEKIPAEILNKIKDAVTKKVATKTGTNGVVNLTKIVPGFGGIVGAAFDSYATNAVGEAAKKIFILNKPPVEVTRYISESEVPDWAR